LPSGSFLAPFEQRRIASFRRRGCTYYGDWFDGQIQQEADRGRSGGQLGGRRTVDVVSDEVMPRRWHIGTLVALLAVLMALGIVRLKWTGDEPGVQIDLKRSAEVGRDAKELLKAAKERLQKNG
jgi:hypothetical protein